GGQRAAGRNGERAALRSAKLRRRENAARRERRKAELPEPRIVGGWGRRSAEPQSAARRERQNAAQRERQSAELPEPRACPRSRRAGPVSVPQCQQRRVSRSLQCKRSIATRPELPLARPNSILCICFYLQGP